MEVNATLDNEARLAERPPMGWNSYTCFGLEVTEDEVRANADYMASHLKHCGWEYVVIDHGWFLHDVNRETGLSPEPACMDEFGRFTPSVKRFPSARDGHGLKGLSDYVHSLGLKLGIHVMRGIPREAVSANTPVLGTDVRAAEVADRESTCEWSQHMFGVDTSKPGSQEWYDSLFALYAQWGIDFVKVDDISQPYHIGEIEQVHAALSKCGRDMVLSLSPGPAPIDQLVHLRAHANMWRTTDDVWDKWEQVEAAFEVCARWAGLGIPGAWPDMDMLPFGRIGLRQHPLNSPDRWTRLTRNEQTTMFTLWLIFRSPLMLGGNLPDTDDWTLSLITNEEALSVLGNSRDNREFFRHGKQVAWTATGNDGCRFLALFNLGSSATEMKVCLAELGLAGSCFVRDLWARRDEGVVNSRIGAEVPPHGVRLLRLTDS